MKNQIKKTVTKQPITISRVYKSDYQKDGTKTAELKQKVTVDTYYPSKVVATNLQDNIFEATEFGFEPQKFSNTETRVAWIDVPENTTMEVVKTRIDALKGATLYKVMSNKPILSNTEEYAINNPELEVNLDTFANRQVVRYPQNHEKAGQIVLDKNGKVQYRRIAFSKTIVEDIDKRVEDPKEVYMSPEIKQELGIENNVIAEQTL